MNRSIAIFSALVLAAQMNAQVYTMADGSVTACSGAFVDSGGEGAGGYQNNENYTTTICSDGGGPAISLQFITFTLSTAGAPPLDQLSIYDGPDTSSPLIGTWSGTDSPGIVSASFANTSGCLTLVFISNGTGTGVFSSILSCFQPCEPPTAVANAGQPIPALICQNETVTFDASASYAADGFNVVDYIWNFDDGVIDGVSGPVVQHSFDEPGEYVVQVTLVDDNGCQSTNLVDLQMLVSTTPIFLGTTESTVICQGDVVDLNGVATPVTWSAIPEANFGDGIYLPDQQGVPFNSTLTFEGFAPGSTLTDIADLESVCVEMEHSFMGDLVIYLTCPNGQSVTFHQQQGGGTFIGGALDGETVPPSPGECWEYCWSPFATNGTWAENAGGTLPSGTYESVNPMSSLVGCPLNGTWTFTVVDQWSIDDGFLCSWELNFNPDLFPELTQFTPVLGLSSVDSTSWTGTGYQAGSTPATGIGAPSQPGVYPYVFSVTDNFGCTYDTTITITVNPSPQGPLYITGDNLYCEGGIAYLNAPPGFDSYVWSNGAVGPNISVVSGGTYTVTVGLGNCVLPSEPFVVQQAPTPQPVITGPQFSCGGIPVTLSTTEPYAQYQWSNGANTESIAVGTGSYSVIVTSAEGCTGTAAPYPVLVGSDPIAAFSADPPSPQQPGVTVNFTDQSVVNGSPVVNGSYEWFFGIPGATGSGSTSSYTYNYPGQYVIGLIVTTAEGCSDTTYMEYNVRPEEIIIYNVFSPNSDGDNDYFVVENLQYYDNQVIIYNRWGMQIFEAENYQNNWQATDVPDGTYYYIIRQKELGKEYAGHLTILR